MQCVKFGAARATIGFRTAAAGHDFQDWPIVERKLPTHYDRASGEFKFEDGDGLEVDCVIYCTGYRHTFPFLDEPLQLRTPNRLAPDTLWNFVGKSKFSIPRLLDSALRSPLDAGPVT